MPKKKQRLSEVELAALDLFIAVGKNRGFDLGDLISSEDDDWEEAMARAEAAAERVMEHMKGWDHRDRIGIKERARASKLEARLKGPITLGELVELRAELTGGS